MNRRAFLAFLPAMPAALKAVATAKPKALPWWQVDATDGLPSTGVEDIEECFQKLWDSYRLEPHYPTLIYYDLEAPSKKLFPLVDGRVLRD